MGFETEENLLIRKISTTIKSITKRRVNPSEDEDVTNRRFIRLKKINIGWYEDLLKEYNIAVDNYIEPNIPANRKATK